MRPIAVTKTETKPVGFVGVEAFGEDARHAKVGDARNELVADDVDEDVAGGEVAVHDVVFVQEGDAASNAQRQRALFAHAQLPCRTAAAAVQQLVQTVRRKLHHEPERRHHDADQRDHVRMRRYQQHGVHFGNDLTRRRRVPLRIDVVVVVVSDERCTLHKRTRRQRNAPP